MTTAKVDPRLQRNYDGYYVAGAEAEWRALGAIDKADNVLRLCGPLRPRTVLEIGAGEGALLERLTSLGFGERWWALEISSSGLERIDSRSIPQLVECRRFDGYGIPYADDAFDLAILSHVIEHVEHPRLLLHAAARVARHVFVEVPLEHTRRLPADFEPDSVGHLNFYTAQTIRLLLQSCGLEVLAQRESHAPRAAYQHRLGRRGALHWLIKELALRVAPGPAQRRWTYHSALLARRVSRPEVASAPTV